MRTRRVYWPGVVLGVTLAASVWLLTYRVWDVVEYIDRYGNHFHPSERVSVQPWWGVPATVAVLSGGTGVSLRLLPGKRGPVRRLPARVATPAPNKAPASHVWRDQSQPTPVDG